MKIAVISIPQIQQGKHNVKDTRLDQVDKIVKAKKKTYIQIEAVGEKEAFEADVILAHADAKSDLILKDLEFVETRLERASSEEEKAILNRMKAILESEKFLFGNINFTADEQKITASYNLVTNKPVVLAQEAELEDINSLLVKAVKEGGYISFFTAGEKDTRAWLIRSGTTAWEAAGAIHSDIQKGFIRAEIISFADYTSCGGETPAKQAGKQRLEQKDYIMQDCDLANFRFNK